jgi:hypothetical protein
LRSKNIADLHLINDLETTYINAWNKYASSRGKGPATGKAFEKWIVDRLRGSGKTVEKGKIKFRFGEFQVDAAIPSLANPQIILEIKIYTDIQHSLMLRGLIDELITPNTKIGLVTLYTPGTFYKIRTPTRTPDAISILNNLKAIFPNRFDYFHIQDKWTNTITQLINFC